MFQSRMIYRGMVQVNQQPTTIIKIVPRDGVLEIKLDVVINVNTDGVSNLSIKAAPKQSNEDATQFIVPNFNSGITLDFGKSVEKGAE